MLTSNNYLGLREPPADPRGPEARRRPLGRRARLRPLHLRHPGAPPRARGGDRVLLRNGRRDPLHDVLERERGTLRRRPRRAGRALLRRAQPRVDHRRRPPVQGEALPRAAQRHEAFERMLEEDGASRFRLMITDGVFSMEGEEADLRELVADLRGEGRDPRRRRLARDGRPRRDGARHGRGAGRARSDPGLDRHARQGDGLRGRRLRDRAARARRDAPPEEPHVPVLELAASRRRGGRARGVPPAARGSGAGQAAPRQRRLLPQGARRRGIPDPPRHASDRAGHRRRHREGARDGQGALRGGRLRVRVRLPGRAAGPGAPARARSPPPTSARTSTGRSRRS